MKIFLIIFLAVITMNSAQCYGSTAENIPDHLKKIMIIYNNGVDQLENHENDKALNEFIKVMEAAKDMKDEDTLKIKAAASNNLGNIMMLQGNPVEAEKYYRQAASFNPKHALALNNLGSALLQQGKMDEALKTFQQAIDVDPSLSVAYANLGAIFLDLGMLRKAAEFNLANLKLNPTNKTSFLNLIRIYDLSNLPIDRQDTWETLVRVTGDKPDELAVLISRLLDYGILEQAEKGLPDLLQRFPDNPDLLLQQARLLVLKREWSKANDILADLIKKHPETPNIPGYLAVALLNQNKIDQAEKLAGDTVHKFKNNAQNWYIYGVVLEKQGKNKEARDAYKMALEKNPALAQAQNNLGALAAKENNGKEAIEWFEKALISDPFNKETQYNLGRALVITKSDYRRGVLMLTKVGAKPGPAGERARKFIADLETIAAGGDPGWGTGNDAISALPE